MPPRSNGLSQQNERLDHIIDVLRRAQFGRKSERINDDQMALALEDVETVARRRGRESREAERRSSGARRHESRRANRGHLPAHLPREEIVIEPEARTCPCGGALHVIGEDVSERLDKIPARLRVIVTRRPKYACRSCTDGVVQAPAAEPADRRRLADRGAGRRCADAEIRRSPASVPASSDPAREGMRIDRSTLAHWVGFAAVELEPLHARLVEILKSSTKLFADETRCPVLDPGRGRTKTGYLWAIARDDRPWGGTDPPAVAYLYAPGRGAEHAVRHLAGFSGVLQVDGYAAYDALTDAKRAGGPLTLAFCWSHLPPPLLRHRERRQRADREGGAGAHRQALRDRGRYPRPIGG